MASVQANGIAIEFEQHGPVDGEPLLMVMGLGGQLIDWPQGLVDEIVARGFRLITFDNRDSGLSTAFTTRPPSRRQLAKSVLTRRPIRNEYTLDDMAADAVGLLDALEIDSAHVVGMSMGGMIAQLMAISHPQRVRSLTSIMSTTGNWRVGRPLFSVIRNSLRRDVPTRENAVEAGIEVFREVSGPTFSDDDFRALAERAIARSWRPEGTARQTAAILAASDRTPGLRSLRMPVLVIHGMLDPLVRVSGGLATAKAVPGSRLVLFNDMAHDLPPTRWSEIADEIRSISTRAAHAPRPPAFA